VQASFLARPLNEINMDKVWKLAQRELANVLLPAAYGMLQLSDILTVALGPR
jgi:hypothetical protein